jgi:hypothetical protein
MQYGLGRRCPRRRVAAACAAVLASTAASAASAAPSYAGILPLTTTTVTMSAGAVGPAQFVDVKATVGGLSLAVTPYGQVGFTDAANNKLLGVVPLTGPCVVLLSQCTAQLTVPGSALAVGQNEIVANYSGDSLSDPSTGYNFVDRGTVTSCGPGSSACVATISAGALAFGAVQVARPESGTETVAVALGKEQLGCATCGPILSAQIENPGGGLLVNDTIGGAAAVTEHRDHGLGYVCYDDPLPFLTATGVESVGLPDGSYSGVLPVCLGPPSAYTNTPCEYASRFVPGTKTAPAGLEVQYATYATTFRSGL